MFCSLWGFIYVSTLCCHITEKNLEYQSRIPPYPSRSGKNHRPHWNRYLYVNPSLCVYPGPGWDGSPAVWTNGICRGVTIPSLQGREGTGEETRGNRGRSTQNGQWKSPSTSHHPLFNGLNGEVTKSNKKRRTEHAVRVTKVAFIPVCNSGDTCPRLVHSPLFHHCALYILVT